MRPRVPISRYDVHTMPSIVVVELVLGLAYELSQAQTHSNPASEFVDFDGPCEFVFRFFQDVCFHQCDSLCFIGWVLDSDDFVLWADDFESLCFVKGVPLKVGES